MIRRAMALGVLIGMTGCAHFRPTPTVDAPEAVGNLSASYHSVAVAPVHATTDLTPSFGVVDTDETVPVTVEPDAGHDAESPAVVEKAAHGF